MGKPGFKLEIQETDEFYGSCRNVVQMFMYMWEKEKYKLANEKKKTGCERYLLHKLVKRELLDWLQHCTPSCNFADPVILKFWWPLSHILTRKNLTVKNFIGSISCKYFSKAIDNLSHCCTLETTENSGWTRTYFDFGPAAWTKRPGHLILPRVLSCRQTTN